MSDKLSFGIKIPKQVWSGSETKQETTPKTATSVRSLIGKMGGRGNESPRGERTERVSPRNPENASSPRNYEVASPRQDLSSPRADSPMREPSSNFRATMGRSETANSVKSPRTKGIEKALTDAPSHKESLPMRRVLVRENTDERKGPPKSMTVGPTSPITSPRPDPAMLGNSQDSAGEIFLSTRHPTKAWPPQPGANLRTAHQINVSGDYHHIQQEDSNQASAEMEHLQKLIPQLSPYSQPRNRKTIPVKVEKARHHIIDFTLPDSEEYITFSDENKRVVKTACFSKIIEKMTANVPLIDMDEVLLCYHSFCLADDIMEALILRYDTPSQEDGKTVKLRILNFIKKWSTAYWYDWILDPSLNEKALNFLNSIETSKVALTIKARLEKRNEMEEEAAKEKQGNLAPPAEPIIPRDIPQPWILQYDPIEIARQMTIIEWEIWSNIQHWELLNLAWTKKDRDTAAKNAMTDRFNFVSDWVVNILCTAENPKTRVTYFQKFLRIADELRNLGNFNGVLEIMSGIRRGPVDRLKKSFNHAIKSPIFQKIFLELDNLTNATKAYLNMRNAIKMVNPPVIPYLGMYQTDLLMTDSGNPDEINGLINYNKYRLSTETIKKIKQYQLTGYSLRTVEDLYQQLLVLCPYKLPEEKQYDMSYYLEPRDGKEQGPRPPCLDAWLHAYGKAIDTYYESKKKRHDLTTLEYENIDFSETGENIFVDMPSLIEKAITSSDPTFAVALLATYRQFISAGFILSEIKKNYALQPVSKSNDMMMRIGNLLKTWIVQYWKDFEEEPELLNQIDELFNGQEFAVYKSTILQPLINRNKSFEMPQPVMYRLDQLDIFQISPFEYAKQLIHYTYACVVSKININKIFIEAASLSNPRLVDFNIFNVKDQTTVLKLAQGKYSGIAGIELVAESTYKKKKKDEKKGNIEPITSAPIRDCFVAKRAIEWFMQTLYCSLNGAVDWFRHFRSQGDFIPLDDTLKDNLEIETSESLWRFSTMTNPIYDVFLCEPNDYVSNFRNNIYKHLTVIQAFVVREVIKESKNSRGAQAIHQFILIGQELIKHHNWYTVFALVSALHSLVTPDNQSLWDVIPPKDRQWFLTTRNLILDPQELRKTIYSIPTVGPFNSSFTIIHILIDDLMAINKKYPNVVDSENRINLRRILELSKILEAHIRTCSIFPPNFEKYEQIQNFISGAI